MLYNEENASIGIRSSVAEIPYMNDAHKELLNSKGIHTVVDLLNYLPYRYEDTKSINSVSNFLRYLDRITLLKLDDNKRKYIVCGRVVSGNTVFLKGRNSLTRIVVEDLKESGSTIELVWFNQSYVKDNLPIGTVIVWYGAYVIKKRKLSFVNPVYEVFRTKKQLVHLGRITPIYRAIGRISTKYLRRYFTNLLVKLPNIEEYVPREILEKFGLIDIDKAYKAIHFPEDIQSIGAGYERLAVQEIVEYITQIEEAVSTIKKKKSTLIRERLSVNSEELLSYINALPFKLTNHQLAALDKLISICTTSKEAEDIFVYGDVGSGKTIVFLLLALIYLTRGKSVVFMAPTTILASQHFDTIERFIRLFKLEDLLNIELLLGKSKVKKVGLTGGKMLIGTHALLFRNLELSTECGLVCIDEQHRFGVKQRDELASKLIYRGRSPHVLTLSATPIPRTLARSFYRYNKSIYIKGKPAGRMEPITRVVPLDKREDMFKFIKERVINLKEQAYIIFPLIEKSEVLSMFSILTEYPKLKKFFGGLNVEMLHGKVKEQEKSRIMEDFYSGKIDILCATPVIEVGIDVPNSNCMVIYDADHFGLAQLHQLRGRIGRGNKESYCFVLPSLNSSVKNERLCYFASSGNGLELAKYDLKHRGAGELFGVQQSGVEKTKIADFSSLYLINRATELYDELKERGVKVSKYIFNT